MSCLTGRSAKGSRCLECILRDGPTLARGCSCDPRFCEVTHDIDCSVHGIAVHLDLRVQEAA